MRLTGSFHTMVRQGRAGSSACSSSRCCVSPGTVTGPGAVAATILPPYALPPTPHPPPDERGARRERSRRAPWWRLSSVSALRSDPVPSSADERHDERDHEDRDTDPDEDLGRLHSDSDDEHDDADNDENQPQGHSSSLRSRRRPTPAVAVIVAEVVQVGTSRAKVPRHRGRLRWSGEDVPRGDRGLPLAQPPPLVGERGTGGDVPLGGRGDRLGAAVLRRDDPAPDERQLERAGAVLREHARTGLLVVAPDDELLLRDAV